MLTIRMQRTGRKGHAQFRVVVQDARRTPTSGQIVAHLGSYDPHTKTAVLVADKVKFYLEHGAQPSPRAVRLLKAEGLALPNWVQAATKKSGVARHPEKLRKNQPASAAANEPSEAPANEPEQVAAEAPAIEAEAPVAEEQTAEPQAEVKEEAKGAEVPESEPKA